MTTVSESIGVFYDFIEDPPRAAEAARRDAPLTLGIGAYLLSALSLFLAQAISGKTGLFGLTWMSISFVTVWSVGMGILQTGLVHVVAEVCGGKGRAVSLFVMLGLSELAWALVLPGVLVVQAFFPDSRWGLPVVSFFVSVICIFLKVRCIRLNYRFGSLQAWFSILFPYLAVAAACAFIFLAAIWDLVRGLKGLML
ncbi:MAG: hypothetical protein ABIJ96_13890 [Elusimicrobiota bacterium]